MSLFPAGRSCHGIDATRVAGFPRAPLRTFPVAIAVAPAFESPSEGRTFGIREILAEQQVELRARRLPTVNNVNAQAPGPVSPMPKWILTGVFLEFN
jgi:hypothetical protein